MRALLLAVTLAACCGDDDAPAPDAGCSAGQTEPCTCADGRPGARPCQADGVFGPCFCTGPAIDASVASVGGAAQGSAGRSTEPCYKRRVSVLDELADKRVVLVLGKGGVGRTTVAAAIAAGLAARGRTTLLFQANAKEKLSRLFGARPIGEEIVELRENLFAVNTNASAALHEYGLMVLRYETVYRLVMENQVAKKLLRAIPGLDDYAIVGKMWWHTTQEEAGGQPRWDTIVFDAPATGHALTMFKIPRAILEAVPQGPLTRDAVKVMELLEDPRRTAAVLVTLAEEMPVHESVELAGRLKDELRIRLSHVIVNQVWPERFFQSGTPSRVLDALLGDGAGAADDPEVAALVTLARTARARRQLNERYLARLAAEIAAPQVRLPLLFTPTLGPADVATLTAAL